MGRKKKKQLKPWCWYCNREFDDEKILIQHQKSKHFKCTFCHKKLYTGPGLSIHSMQVHKEKIDKIPFALPHRSNVEIEIYGMEGIPDEDIKEHERQKMGKEDEVDEKRPKLEVPISTQMFSMPGIPLTAPGVPFIPPLTLPVMPPLQFGLAPPPILVRPNLPVAGLLQPGLARLNPITTTLPMGLVMQPQQPIPSISISNNSNSETSIPPPPPPPPTVESTVAAAVNTTPTFPAYSGTVEVSKTVQKVTKPTSSTQGLKVILVHPEDDLPLEQIRLKLSKYSHFLHSATGSVASGAPFTSTITTAIDDVSWGRPMMHMSDSHDLAPPPPPPTLSAFVPQLTQIQRAPAALFRPWIAPNFSLFVKPHNFTGGPGGF